MNQPVNSEFSSRANAGSQTLHIAGCRVLVESDEPLLLQWLAFDFAGFLPQAEGPSELRFIFRHHAPPLSCLPKTPAVMHTPNFLCYDEGCLRYVDYFGRALSCYDYRNEQGLLFSLDVEFGYEKLMLMILSRVGERLDRRGLHRVHGLGFSLNQRICLFPLPQRGGKTSLALELFKDPSFLLFSEDTPLVDSRSRLHPFPFRIGARQDTPLSQFPAHEQRMFHREQHGSKALISARAFCQQLATKPARLEFLLIPHWTSQDQPSITPLSRWRCFAPLFRDLVFGLGLPQLVEYFLRLNNRAIGDKAWLIIRRIWTTCSLMRHAQCYRFTLCRDAEKNAALLRRFLEEQPASEN